MTLIKKLIPVSLFVSLILLTSAFAHPKVFEFETKPSFAVDAGLQPNLILKQERNPLDLTAASKTTPQISSSKGKSLFLSFLIPGLGEYYSGHKTRAKAFFITEVLLWSTYAGFKIYENWIEDEYKVFATDHARIDAGDKPHKFFVNIGNYDNIHDYNAVKLNYRQLDDVYPDSYAWDWDSDANRHDFKMMRIRADNANYGALFMLGTILVNHIVSAIDAVWVSRSTKDSDDQSRRQSLNLQFDSRNSFRQYQLVYTRAF